MVDTLCRMQASAAASWGRGAGTTAARRQWGVAAAGKQQRQQHLRQSACCPRAAETSGATELSRRELLACGTALLLSGAAPSPATAAEQESFKSVADATLAYEFKYPVETVSGAKLSMAFSRKPEKYSSAAPLSADARQRIVTELLDLLKAVTVSVTVGPAAGVLKSKSVDDWEAEAVAETVLIDRSTARVTTGQRVAINSIEAAAKEERDGKPYYVFEHVSQGAPNLSSGRMESYRHALAVTSVRPGMDGTPYLYTLNLACPDEAWEDLEPYFQEAAQSFRLAETSRGYVPPDKDPWLFF